MNNWIIEWMDTILLLWFISLIIIIFMTFMNRMKAMTNMCCWSTSHFAICTILTKFTIDFPASIEIIHKLKQLRFTRSDTFKASFPFFFQGDKNICYFANTPPLKFIFQKRYTFVFSCNPSLLSVKWLFKICWFVLTTSNRLEQLPLVQYFRYSQLCFIIQNMLFHMKICGREW